MARNDSYNALLSKVTKEYIYSLDKANLPSKEDIEVELLALSNKAINEYNLGPEAEDADEYTPFKERYPNRKFGSDRIPSLRVLSPLQIADLMIALDNVCRISTSKENRDPDYDVISIYNVDGYNEGTYTSDEDSLRRLARAYNYTMTISQFSEIMTALRDRAPWRVRCFDKDLVAVNNGIFNYATKQLMPFDKEYVFITKSHVDYVENAPNPIITMPDGEKWDVESWMHSLSDDPEIVTLLWQIIGAIIRPNVPWNKSAWLYSENGNNGKGTLCTLMRNICGAGAYASIPLSDFSKDFMLEPLTRASAIIVDENDVGTYIDRAANLKAIITNDVFSINRKFKAPIAYQFYGFMVQCMNEFPKVKDRSDSFYRRQLFIPMDKRFEGIERRYIKDTYLYRDDVLQYVLYHVLHDTDYYELTIPQACLDVLNEYKEFNDPIRQFYKELEEKSQWTLLPYTYIYDLYTCWFRTNQPSGTIISKLPFMREIKKLTEQSDIFFIDPQDPQIRAKNRMDCPEPLIFEYGVQKWFNSSYHGNDPNQIANPNLSDKRFRGIQKHTKSLPAENVIITDEESNNNV